MRILVSGAGVAGLSAGITLTATGHDVTIVERANHLRVNGSPIDVRGESVGIAEKMGILDQIRSCQIDMSKRIHFVGRDGEVLATPPQAEINDSDDDIEIAREDLAGILHAALPSSAELIFGDSIDRLDDNGDEVEVHFQSGSRDRYDLVVGADGLHSATRRLTFGPESAYLRHLGFYTALARVPSPVEPGATNPMYNYPGHLAGIAHYRDKALAVFIFRSAWIDYDYHDLDVQKQILADAFAGHDEWQIPELLAAAQNDPELYFDSVSQIDMPAWYRGNVVLVGDAAHCASPLSGRGTSLALTAAWFLAQALRARPGDTQQAFQRYEHDQRPHAARAQATAPVGGDLLVPATQDALDTRNRRLSTMTP